MATIRYIVTDTDQAVTFYTELLGFEVVERWGPAFAILSKGDLKLWVSGPQTSAAQPMPDGRKPEAGGWNRIVIEVEDIQAVVEKLKQAGASFRNAILPGTGGQQILVDDPSGNAIELFQSK